MTVVFLVSTFNVYRNLHSSGDYNLGPGPPTTEGNVSTRGSSCEWTPTFYRFTESVRRLREDRKGGIEVGGTYPKYTVSVLKEARNTDKKVSFVLCVYKFMYESDPILRVQLAQERVRLLCR